MAKNSSRNSNRDLLRKIDRTVDFKRLDLGRDAEDIKDKSRLTGLFTAMLSYGAIFGLGYMLHSSSMLGANEFSKLTWLAMIPASVIAIVALQYTRSRLETPIREAARSYIIELEGEAGWLQRFEPIFNEVDAENGKAKRVFEHLKEKRYKRLAPEDYLEIIDRLRELLRGEGESKISPATINNVRDQVAAV